MEDPDSAVIEASARRRLHGASSDDDAVPLALLRDCDHRTVVLVRTILDGRLLCHSLVVFGEAPEYELDGIYSDISQIGTTMAIGPEGLAEDLGVVGGGESSVVALRHADDIVDVIDDEGVTLALTTGTGFVLVCVDQRVEELQLRARTANGTTRSPISIGHWGPLDD